MRPENLKTKIFLDSGGADETEQALGFLGFLDGQTTNPSYFAKSTKVKEHLENKGKYSSKELNDSYKETIQRIHKLLPNEPISIEVYADKDTKAEAMMEQARIMSSWTPQSYIKLPIIPEGLKAAEMAVQEGIRINLTLCFNQEQAAAVYSATKGAKPGDVYVSPFMGRHFDNGNNGLDLVKNIIKMYEAGDGHVQILTASLRNIDQFYAAIHAGTDIITAGFKYLKDWADDGIKVPEETFKYDDSEYSHIEYKEIDLEKHYTKYNIEEQMTSVGLEKFVSDWNSLVE